ncbi:MAG: substrate-binding domain-containing protein, partial [Planctomycetota bacterium]
MVVSPNSRKRVAILIALQWSVPWHLDCFQGVIEFGNEHGWDCVVDPYLDGATGDGNLASYDGALGRIYNSQGMQIKAMGTPVVNFLHTEPDHGFHTVRVDAVTGTRLAAEHLIANGYRRFGHISIGTEVKAYADQVINTFKTSVTSQGWPAPALIRLDNNALDREEASKVCLQTLAEWIKGQPKPIGVYVYVFELARYLAQICSQLGLRVPQDVGIIVQDADTVNTTHISPTLSAIDFDYWEQGYQAAAVLDRLMRGERVEPKNKLIQPRRVIVCESTDIFICDDELVSEAMRYIARHCRRTLSADEIADELEVSRRTLDRRFEEVSGRTVSSEVVHQRIEQIEHTLVETGLPMVKIAELFGFGSANLGRGSDGSGIRSAVRMEECQRLRH